MPIEIFAGIATLVFFMTAASFTSDDIFAALFKLVLGVMTFASLILWLGAIRWIQPFFY